MSRLPNPWVAVPVLLATTGGAIVGYVVTDASCAPGSCPGLAGLVAVLVGAATAVGVGIVAVLALKSMSEWRRHAEREILTAAEPDEPPGPPTC